jgi:type IV secretory pathway VirB10-like protein
MEAVARSLRVPFIAAPLAAIVMPSTAMATLAVKVGLSRSGLLSWGAGSTVAASGVVLAMALTRPTSPPPPPAPTAPLPAHPASDQVSQKPAEPAVTAEVAETPSPPINPVKELPALWDEPQLIERARKALASEPRRALSLTQEHQRRFPAGALAVERDVIALEALARSGQTAEAKRRARAFEAKYPKSIHLPRVRALLARLGSE